VGIGEVAMQESEQTKGQNADEKELSEVEISSLRDEIAADARQCLDLTKYAVAFTTALIGAALTTNSFLIALLPILVLLAARAEIINKKGNTLRIATYLTIFGRSKMRYEYRLWLLRLKTREDPLKGWSGHAFGTFQILSLAGYVSIVASSYLLYFPIYRYAPDSLFKRILLWLPISIITLLSWHMVTKWQQKRLRNMVGHGQLEHDLQRRWKNLGW
jgi:hypothetical protein